MNLLTGFNICIGMHSVKSGTKCITTIGTVNPCLAHTPAIEQQLNPLLLQTLTLFANQDTNSRSRWGLQYVEAIFGLGLNFL